MLFELVDKIDPLVSLAPVLVTRLKGLKGLHAEAAVFSDSIKMISSEQTKISEELKGLDTVSTKVGEANIINKKIILHGNLLLLSFDTHSFSFLSTIIASGEFDRKRRSHPEKH